MLEDNQYPKKHESPVRRMLADSHGTKYEALHTLSEAKNAKDAYLIMEGDDGGQIYLVAPAKMINCDEKILGSLLQELDAKAWDDISMAGLYYEIHESNTIVSGGMGGGKAERGLWVHKDFEDIRDKIQRVLDGDAYSTNQ